MQTMKRHGTTCIQDRVHSVKCRQRTRCSKPSTGIRCKECTNRAHTGGKTMHRGCAHGKEGALTLLFITKESLTYRDIGNFHVVDFYIVWYLWVKTIPSTMQIYTKNPIFIRIAPVSAFSKADIKTSARKDPNVGLAYRSISYIFNT